MRVKRELRYINTTWSRYVHPQQGRRRHHAWAVGSRGRVDRDRRVFHDMCEYTYDESEGLRSQAVQGAD